MNSRELAVIAAEAASDKKADDIVAINVAELLVVTDYFVIATGNTNIQVRAIADEIEEQLRERGGVKPIGREGESEGKWVLLDYGDIVVHVFQPEERGVLPAREAVGRRAAAGAAGERRPAARRSAPVDPARLTSAQRRLAADEQA